mmetsp:Transcript_6176/g.38403  ORF Transcript_6176/g.38403 Transcript_6176/m.38403 type:complete len:213 (+) Transcript_6176:3353-3991(+)
MVAELSKAFFFAQFCSLSHRHFSHDLFVFVLPFRSFVKFLTNLVLHPYALDTLNKQRGIFLCQLTVVRNMTPQNPIEFPPAILELPLDFVQYMASVLICGHGATIFHFSILKGKGTEWSQGKKLGIQPDEIVLIRCVVVQTSVYVLHHGNDVVEPFNGLDEFFRVVGGAYDLFDCLDLPLTEPTSFPFGVPRELFHVLEVGFHFVQIFLTLV